MSYFLINLFLDKEGRLSGGGGESSWVQYSGGNCPRENCPDTLKKYLSEEKYSIMALSAICKCVYRKFIGYTTVF